MSRLPLKPWMWVTWALLTVVAFISVWAATVQYMSGYSAFRSVANPLWADMLRDLLQLYAAPALGFTAVALPLLALVTFLFRRFHPTLLVGIGLSVALLLACVAFEAYWAGGFPLDRPR